MRINCIPVKSLADQHLLAEWVETLMLKPYIVRSINSVKGIDLPAPSERYILGTGHAKFFYDKLKYVQKRYYEIEQELLRRGYKANPTLDFSGLPEELFNDWTPNREDQILNINRIISRILLKPTWYTYKKNQLNWEIFYKYTMQHEYIFNSLHIGNFGNNIQAKKNKTLIRGKHETYTSI
jgi:deoxyribonuclease (pyrimidine dimer)